jgi:hypothetical protein
VRNERVSNVQFARGYIGSVASIRQTLHVLSRASPSRICPSRRLALDWPSPAHRVVASARAKAAAELSVGARALFKSPRQNAKGEIVVETHDRIAAINALNAMQDGALVATRSRSLSINAMIPAARDPDDSDAAQRLFEAFSE